MKILNLEDNPNDTELIQAELEKGGIASEIIRVETEEEFIAAIEKADFDLILADYKLPAYDGMSALSISKERCPDRPFIFVSGTIGEERAIEALKNGATDYVLKEKLSRLAPAVRRALNEAEEIRGRRQTEEALLASEHKYKILLENLPQRIFYKDRNSIYISCNKNFADDLKIEENEIAGKTDYDFFPEELAKKYRADDKRLIELGRCEDIEEKYIKDGKESWVHTVKTLIRDGNDTVTGILGIFWDITDQRRLEGQLRQSQKMEGIGQFAGGIAHDFNNVLNGVIGYAGLLQLKMAENDPLRHFADEIIVAGERGAALTHQILAFSRKQMLDMKPVSINEIIKSIEKMLLRLVREDISIEIRLYDKDLIVLADASQLDQILINLATNAIDAISCVGKLAISTEYLVMDDDYVRMHGFGSPGEFALLSVADTGCGMDAETRVHIFEPFFTTKEVGKGTGLGLAVVHGIVKQHGGHINVYSEVGKGTVFRIYLPLTSCTSEEREKKTVGEIRGGNEVILIAEDDASIRRLSTAVLEQYGYRVIAAVDGEDAVQKYFEHRKEVKLVILDGIMPKKSGKEALDEMRSVCPDIKAIFLSGYTEDILPNSIISGSAALLGKPIKPGDLARNVREMLDK